ncbi:MAG: hypothetical protein ACRBHB_24025 [Arenicella sp.]
MNKILPSILLSLSVLFSAPAFAQSDQAQAKERAMQMAEQQTNGKSLSARFVDRNGRTGFQVRVFKKGKVQHVFIPMSATR